ncbi:hypothetical protein V5799_013391 [Amblyomma americanum]|uniref:BACK domain-containing protein n=1 Tax=Amblyomma americanum TaxID=6943 RepID=A0AAQ4E608_AMBAM
MEASCVQEASCLLYALPKRSELSLYKALMNWIHYDCKARSKYASSLVEAIRFHDMTPGQVEGFKAFKICPEVQKCFDVSQRIPQP